MHRPPARRAEVAPFRVGRPGTDSAHYGGSDMGNPGGIEAEPIPWHWQAASAEVTLPRSLSSGLFPLTQGPAGARSPAGSVIAQRRGVGSPETKEETMAARGSTPGNRTEAGGAALDRLGGSLDAAQRPSGTCVASSARAGATSSRISTCCCATRARTCEARGARSSRTSRRSRRPPPAAAARPQGTRPPSARRPRRAAVLPRRARQARGPRERPARRRRPPGGLALIRREMPRVLGAARPRSPGRTTRLRPPRPRRPGHTEDD